MKGVVVWRIRMPRQDLPDWVFDCQTAQTAILLADKVARQAGSRAQVKRCVVT